MKNSKIIFQLSVLLTFCIISNDSIAAQYTISGYIKDAASGEELIGATAVIKGTNKGTSANVYGFYSLTIEEGDYTISYNFIGYESKDIVVSLNESKIMSVELTNQSVQLQAVEITDAGSKSEYLKEKNISVVSMDIKDVKYIAAVFGEVDILKSIQLMPGIQSAGEGSSGFNVRGGSTDQNLILLDEATVYNASHLLGFFSVFNPDAIKDVKVYKGGIPATYGGRLSSLLDIRMKEGNMKQYELSGGIGTISSKLALEGPIVKDKGSFLLSGRRTYADMFLKLSPDENISSNKLYFYDMNLKANYRINDKNRLFLSGYFGKDVFLFSGLFGFNWGNATATMRWNHLMSDKLFANFTAIMSDFNYAIQTELSESQSFKITAKIRDYGAKSDFSWYPKPNHNVYFGTSSTFHHFSPGSLLPIGDESIAIESELPGSNAVESSIYADHDMSIGSRAKLRYGLRFTGFHNLGDATIYEYDDEGEVSDTLTYEFGEIYKNYFGLEPRANFSFVLNESSSLKASYDRTCQFIHQLSNSGTALPTDLWMPSGPYIKPQIADQLAIGYLKTLPKSFEISMESYYKFMQNQIDYKDNANLLLNEHITQDLLFGEAWSYGLECLIKRNDGRISGWLAYTLAKTMKKIEGINNGIAYPAKNDVRHNLSLVLNAKLTERIILSGTWVFATGAAVTFPSGSYEYDGMVMPLYTERNGYRMPDYHRGDLSLTLNSRKKENKRFESSWNFSVYNFYNRENAYSIIFREKEDENGDLTGQMEAVQITLFKIIPSITWNFKF
jgi:hypothetical protein